VAQVRGHPGGELDRLLHDGERVAAVEVHPQVTALEAPAEMEEILGGCVLVVLDGDRDPQPLRLGQDRFEDSRAVVDVTPPAAFEPAAVSAEDAAEGAADGVGAQKRGRLQGIVQPRLAHPPAGSTNPIPCSRAYSRTDRRPSAEASPSIRRGISA